MIRVHFDNVEMSCNHGDVMVFAAKIEDNGSILQVHPKILKNLNRFQALLGKSDFIAIFANFADYQRVSP